MDKETADLISTLKSRLETNLDRITEPLEDIEKVNIAIIETLSSLLEEKQRDGWVKCRDRLPDKRKVWGSIRFVNEQGIGFWQDDVVYYEGGGRFTDSSGYTAPVVAWRPLPKPFREVQAAERGAG